MVRETLEPGSRHASVVLQRLTSGFQHRFVRRVENGGFTSRTSHDTHEQPDLWLQIGRRGGEIWGTLSLDGDNWLPPDPMELPGLPQEVQVGVASWWRGEEPLPATLCDVTLISGPVFLRGDCNDDGNVDISDAVCVLNWLFLGEAEPSCVAATNVDGVGEVDITDPIYLLSHLFLGGPAPVEPFPECGPGTLEADEALGCRRPSENCQ